MLDTCNESNKLLFETNKLKVPSSVVAVPIDFDGIPTAA